MFYHDHAYGITWLDVYAGEAAAYVVQDPIEQTLVNGGVITSPTGLTATVAAGTIPTTQIPLIISSRLAVSWHRMISSKSTCWSNNPSRFTNTTGDGR